MRTSSSSSLRATALALLATAGVFTASAETVDLTHRFDDRTPTSPKESPFRRQLVRRGENKLGIWVEEYDFCTSELSGTHLEAPRHHSQTGWTVDDIPLDRLWRVPGVVVDVSSRINQSRNKNYEVTVRDLVEWEGEHGVIPDGALVFIHTGWGKMVNNSAAYAGLDGQNSLNFPGVGKGAAEWLAKHGVDQGHQKGVVGVGIDTLSLDKGQSVRLPAQVKLFRKNIFGVENVANLDKLPKSGFYVSVMPVRIAGGTGAPARVVAEVGGGGMAADGAPPTASSTLLVSLLTATLTVAILSFPNA